MKCVLPSTGKQRLERHDKYLNELPSDIAELVHLEQTLNPKNGDTYTSLYDIGEPLYTVENFMSRVTDGEIDTVEKYRSASIAAKEQISQAFRARIQTLTRLGIDWTTEIENSHLSSYAAEIYKAEVRRSKGSTKVLGFLKWPFKALGEWHRAVQEFEPSRMLYAQSKELQAYVGHMRKKIFDGVQAALDTFEKETGLSSDIADKYLGWFDGQYWSNSRREQLMVEFNDDTKTREAIEGVMRRNGVDPAGDNVFTTFERYMRTFQSRYWNKLNYGVENPRDGYDPSAHPESIVGFIGTAGGLLRNILVQRARYAGEIGEELSPAEKKYLARFDPDNADKFHIRENNYVPSRRQIDDDLFSELLAIDTVGFLAPMSRFLDRRGKIFDTSQRFTELIKENVLSFGFAMETVSSYAMAKGTQNALDLAKTYQENNPQGYAAVKYWSDALVTGYERDISAQKSEHMKATRNVLTALHSIGAMILALPSSAINNYLGSALGLYGEFGLDIFKWNKSFKKAMSEDSLDGITAREVEAFSEKFLKSPGRFSDYQSTMKDNAASENSIVKLTEHLKNAAMGIADFATRQGVLLGAQRLMQLTMEQSEQNVRGFVKPLLFDMVRHHLSAVNTDKMSAEEKVTLVRDAINLTHVDAFYKISNALMDPNKENKPFYAWQRAETATNPASALAGSSLSMFYMFRQVTAHNIRLIGNAANRAFDDLMHPELKGIERYSGAGAFGLLFAALIMTIADCFAGKKLSGLPRFSAAVGSNPLQESKTVASGALKIVGAMLNLDMPEDTAIEAQRDLARFGGGVLLGGSFDQLVKEYHGLNDSPLSNYFSLVDAIKGDFDLLTNLPRIVLGQDPYGAVARTSGDFYDMKKDIATKADTAYPWFSYQNDYIGFARTIAQIMIPVEEDSYAERERGDFARHAILSLFGLSPNYLPEAYSNAYGRRDTFEYDAMSAERYARNSGVNARMFYNTIGDRALRQIATYGKLYPQSLSIRR